MADIVITMRNAQVVQSAKTLIVSRVYIKQITFTYVPVKMH